MQRWLNLLKSENRLFFQYKTDGTDLILCTFCGDTIGRCGQKYFFDGGPINRCQNLGEVLWQSLYIWLHCHQESENFLVFRGGACNQVVFCLMDQRFRCIEQR